MWTFIGSILWIAVFSYLMVWWATVAGDTAGIPPAVRITQLLAAEIRNQIDPYSRKTIQYNNILLYFRLWD